MQFRIIQKLTVKPIAEDLYFAPEGKFDLEQVALDEIMRLFFTKNNKTKYLALLVFAYEN
jgi:hypothetical protein